MHFVQTIIAAGVWALASAVSHAQSDLAMTPYGPVVEVQLGEGQQFRVLLDTGAATSVFDALSAADLDLTLLQAVNVGSNTGMRTQAGIYQTGPLVFGTYSTETVQLLVLDLAAQGGPFVDGIAGVLSPNVFGPGLIEIDFGAGQVFILDESARPGSDGQPYSANNLPTAAITIAGTAHVAQIDTGASALLILPASLASDLPLVAPPVTSGSISTVNDTVSVSTATLDGTIEIAGVVFERPELEFVEGAEWILIGMAALRAFVVTLDPTGGEVWLTPAPH